MLPPEKLRWLHTNAPWRGGVQENQPKRDRPGAFSNVAIVCYVCSTYMWRGEKNKIEKCAPRGHKPRNCCVKPAKVVYFGGNLEGYSVDELDRTENCTYDTKPARPTVVINTSTLCHWSGRQLPIGFSGKLGWSSAPVLEVY